MNEVDAMAFLLEQDFGFDQYVMLTAYQSTANSFLVRYGIDTSKDEGTSERSFKTAKEAAEFYIEKRRQLKI
jgi:hypothetical protein